MIERLKWYHFAGLSGLALLVAGTWIGLFVAPAERHMGDVMRIMYVHVPSAWSALLCFTFVFVAGIASLWTARRSWDACMTAAIEVGCVLTALLLVQGSIWARATWGVWWDWDVRLTTSLVMLLLFCGVLVLRSFVEEANRRANWSAIAAIVAFVDVPLVYFCVRWWRSLHQIQSSPETVSSTMVLPLRINAVAFLLIAVWMIVLRARLELARRQAEDAPEPEPLAIKELQHV